MPASRPLGSTACCRPLCISALDKKLIGRGGKGTTTVIYGWFLGFIKSMVLELKLVFYTTVWYISIGDSRTTLIDILKIFHLHLIGKIGCSWWSIISVACVPDLALAKSATLIRKSHHLPADTWYHKCNVAKNIAIQKQPLAIRRSYLYHGKTNAFSE